MNQKQKTRLFIGAILLIGLFLFIQNYSVEAQTTGFTEEKIQIESEGEVLNGVILIPDDSESNAGIVLVHGAGAHDQNAYRKEAEAFAQNGITTLIYDKRTIGYRADGVGENSRSYSLLAEDALAAVKLLQSHPNVNSERVGLWGESEGGSVTTLAASRSGDVSFVITVGANGVPPIQQTSWHLENTLRHQGVTAHSFLNAVTRKSLRFALSAEMFAEAT